MSVTKFGQIQNTLEICVACLRGLKGGFISHETAVFSNGKENDFLGGLMESCDHKFGVYG
jgi:hypothetical protein